MAARRKHFHLEGAVEGVKILPVGILLQGKTLPAYQITYVHKKEKGESCNIRLKLSVENGMQSREISEN